MRLVSYLGYEAVKLYGHMAVHTKSIPEFAADTIYCEPIRTFRIVTETLQQFLKADAATEQPRLTE